MARSLADSGHAVRTEARGSDALSVVVDWQPDVVVLDLGLPDLDGTDVLRMIRSVSSVPVIVATARDDEVEIVKVLDAGADDYVIKPYSASQLDARIRAVLRRAAGPGDESRSAIVIDDLVIDRRPADRHPGRRAARAVAPRVRPARPPRPPLARGGDAP